MLRTRTNEDGSAVVTSQESLATPSAVSKNQMTLFRTETTSFEAGI